MTVEAPLRGAGACCSCDPPPDGAPMGAGRLRTPPAEDGAIAECLSERWPEDDTHTLGSDPAGQVLWRRSRRGTGTRTVGRWLQSSTTSVEAPALPMVGAVRLRRTESTRSPIGRAREILAVTRMTVASRSHAAAPSAARWAIRWRCNWGRSRACMPLHPYSDEHPFA